MRSQPPMVSVVIPACNAGGFLRETVESVLAQTFRSFEVVVVDDGSTDDTPTVAAALSRRDSRIRVLRQPNAGVGAARNTGIRLARGKYIAPLDADDLWSPHKLERQVARIESSGPGVGLVYCWSRNIDPHNRVLSWSHCPRIEGRVGTAMLLGNFLGTASVPLFRASAVAAVGRYVTRDEQHGGQGCEDWDLSIRIAERYRISCVPEYLVSYRQCAAGMSLNLHSMAKSYAVVMRRARARNPGLPPHLLAWSAGRFYSYLANNCYRWSNYLGALQYVGRALWADPVSWLNPRNYRLGALSLVHLVSRGKLRRFPAPPPALEPADLSLAVSPPDAANAETLFARIQRKRFDQALRLGTRRRARVSIRSALAC